MGLNRPEVLNQTYPRLNLRRLIYTLLQRKGTIELGSNYSTAVLLGGTSVSRPCLEAPELGSRPEVKDKYVSLPG